MLAQTNLVDLYISKETSWGEDPSTPAMKGLPYTGESLGYGKEVITSEQIRSDRQRDMVAMVGFGTLGDVNFEYQYANFDAILEGLMNESLVTLALSALSLTVVAASYTITRATGSWITDGVVPGIWIKTGGFVNGGNNGVFKVDTVTATVITLVNTTTGLVDEGPTAACTVDAKFLKVGNTLKSLLIEKRFTDIAKYIYFSGLRAGTGVFNMASKEIMKGVFSFMGFKGVSGSSSIAGSSTPALDKKVVSCATNLGNIRKDGVAIVAPIKNIGLTIENNLRSSDQLASLNPAGVGTGFCDVTGTLEAYFQDLAMYEELVNHTTVSLDFRITDEDGNVTIFTIPKLYFTGGTPVSPGGNEDVMLPLEYTGILDPITNTTLQIDFIDA